MKNRDEQILLTESDIRDAAADEIITEFESQRLIHWARERRASSPAHGLTSATPEAAKGFNLVTVAYYFGAMLMISACAWFLGDKWESLGSTGVLVTTVIYFAIAVAVGLWLRTHGYIVGGGLLITVAVCLVPLITFSLEDILGFWPAERPGAYGDYYPYIHGSWIIMELATMAIALIALLYVRFGFLTAPFAFSLWFFSMDFAAWFMGRDSLSWNGNAWMAVMVGAVTIIFGYVLERSQDKPDQPRSQDFGFWCYLFGLMAFWGGLTSLDSDSETGRFIYLLINVGLVALALYLKRSTFLVFGAIGIHVYLGHLAYTVFKDSFLFPFVLALLGLSLILVTVFAQSYLRKMSERGSTAD